MLHGLVESIIRTILDTDSLVLKQSCFADGKLVTRVLDAYSKNAQNVKGKKACRLGYMGHLVRLCGAIAYVLDRDLKLKEILLGEQQKEWDAFVAGPLHQDNESHNAVLAGGAPSFPGAGTGGEHEEPQSQFTTSAYSNDNSRALVPTSLTKPDDDDGDPFAFNDSEDTFSNTPNYGLPRDEEEWNNTGTTQFDEWRTDYHPREAGAEEHSDSSDEEPQPNFTPTENGGSSDDEEEDYRGGKGKKKSSTNTTKEDGKSDNSSPAKVSDTAGTSGSVTSSPAPVTSTNGNRGGDEWAAFED